MIGIQQIFAGATSGGLLDKPGSATILLSFSKRLFFAAATDRFLAVSNPFPAIAQKDCHHHSLDHFLQMLLPLILGNLRLNPRDRSKDRKWKT
jgi:hypothetical protein